MTPFENETFKYVKYHTITKVSKMNREEKIEKILEEDKIFCSSETDRYKYYICKGVSGKIYDVIFFKGQDKWKCDCNNVRTSNCYHIEAAKRLDENEN